MELPAMVMEALVVEQIAQRYHITPDKVHGLPSSVLMHMALVNLYPEGLHGGK